MLERRGAKYLSVPRSTLPSSPSPYLELPLLVVLVGVVVCRTGTRRELRNPLDSDPPLPLFFINDGRERIEGRDNLGKDLEGGMLLSLFILF